MPTSPRPAPKCHLVGLPGTTAFFHCDILHSSGHNLSRHDRWQTYFVYNCTADRQGAVPNPRPDHIRSANTAPLRLGGDDIVTPSAKAAAAKKGGQP